jgi:hypothetical protein
MVQDCLGVPHIHDLHDMVCLACTSIAGLPVQVVIFSAEIASAAFWQLFVLILATRCVMVEQILLSLSVKF